MQSCTVLNSFVMLELLSLHGKTYSMSSNSSSILALLLTPSLWFDLSHSLFPSPRNVDPAKSHISFWLNAMVKGVEERE